MAENNYCVYMHVNKLNDKKYIGITCQTPSRRWQNGYGYKNKRFTMQSKNMVGIILII